MATPVVTIKAGLLASGSSYSPCLPAPQATFFSRLIGTGLAGRASRHVEQCFCFGQWQSTGFVPDHSGGSAPD